MKNPIALNNNKNTQVSPLFLLHEIIGSTHYYHPLAARLEDKMPVYGLELLNSGICLKDLTMRKLASEYVKLIKTVQSSVPYRLAGWSAGGLFAYEIAYQLIGAGEEVEFIGLFEVWRPLMPEVIPEGLDNTIDDCETFNGNIAFAESQDSFWDDEDERLSFALDYFELELDILPFAKFIDDKNSTLLFNSDRIEEMLVSQELEPIFELIARERDWDKEFVIEKLNVAQAINKVLSQYVPPRLPTTVNLFYTENLINEELDKEIIDLWQPLLGDYLKTTSTPGEHMNMLLPPQVDTLAESVLSCIKENQSKSQGRDPTLASGATSSSFLCMNRSSSDSPILFCIPGSGSSAVFFMELVEAIHDQMMVLAAQPKGLFIDSAPHPSIESAAEFYLEKIMDEFPHQPIHILGHSFGGLVAHELAARFATIGRQVEALILIDPSSPERNDYVLSSRADYLLLILQLLEQSFNRSANVKRSDLLVLNEDEQIKLLLTKLKSINPLAEGLGELDMRQIVNSFIQNNQLAFSPKENFQGKTLYVGAAQSSKTAVHTAKDKAEQWNNIVSGLEVLSVDGNHMSILKSPQVKEVAKKILETCL